MHTGNPNHEWHVHGFVVDGSLVVGAAVFAEFLTVVARDQQDGPLQ
jgi:hypothetical protein